MKRWGPKLPSSKKTKNAGNGPTDFHQDFPNYAVDRSGGMNFWLALEDYDALEAIGVAEQVMGAAVA